MWIASACGLHDKISHQGWNEMSTELAMGDWKVLNFHYTIMSLGPKVHIKKYIVHICHRGYLHVGLCSMSTW